MNLLDQNPYRGLTPEELHAVVRRAHAERAQALRAFFSGLFVPRKKAAEHPDAEAAAACR
jgi:hypothetical protein